MSSSPAIAPSTSRCTVTLLYVFLTVPLKLAFALFIAVHPQLPAGGIGFFRSAFYLPSILGGTIAMAVLWRYMFAATAW